MGIFAGRKGRSGTTSPRNNSFVENIRRADGSTVQEKIHQIPEETDDDSLKSLNDEKVGESHTVVSTYPVTPTDSIPPPKSFSRASIIADLYPQSQYDEEYEPSERSLRLRRKWKSSRLTAGEIYEKPWLNEKIPRRSWEVWIFYAGVLLGSAIGGWLVWKSWSNVTNSQYCLIMDDGFTGINEEYWNFEVQRGGFGTGSFEWTTTDPENIYTDDTGLHIVPTLTVETTNITQAQLLSGATLNLTKMGVCTSDVPSDCVITSNSTSGNIINPVRSARISTKGKKKITYGKVEVVARLPRGDWLWPAIWMMPEDDVYGVWPNSGEIDIMESRGNAPPFPGGRDQISSTLHWGPNSDNDGYWRTLGQHFLPRTDFSVDFHTFGLEWNSKYLFCYLDSRLLQVLFVQFPKGSNMWNRGNFGTNSNQSALYDPWTMTGRPNTPFDQDFYLILNVAVGGTNGFFVDQVGNKPWVNNNEYAPRAFWNAVNQWYPTWGAGDTKGMTVQSVKMYTLGACS